MARQVRIEFPGAFYHVMARGNHLEPIFRSEDASFSDQELFLKTLDEACQRYEWKVWAWVLMKNHYHLVLETPKPTLVAGMSWLQNTYTRRFNVRHKQWGRLFGDRYKSVLVEEKNRVGSSSYLTTLLDYVHLNPIRAGLVNRAKGESVMDYPWSSVVRGYALSAKKRPNWLRVTEGLELVGLTETAHGRRKFVGRLDAAASAIEAERAGLTEIDGQTLHSTLRRGWYWGGEAFKESMMKKLDELASGESGLPMSGPYTGEGQKADYALRAAELIISEGLKHFKIKKGNSAAFDELERGDLRCVAIAWAVRKKTSVSLRWIAERFAMKSPSNVSQRVRNFGNTPRKKLVLELKKWCEMNEI